MEDKDKMGSCNGCQLSDYKKKLGDKFLMLGNTIYELDKQPAKGQNKPYENRGRPICFVMWGMSLEHSSDEDCNKF